MVSKKFWENKINQFVDTMRLAKSLERTHICAVPFQILPNVFSPVYSSDTGWFAEKIAPLTKGKRFLEIGVGSGVISCLAALNGSSKVVATDINPEAIKNTLLNAKNLSVTISARLGSVFDPITPDELFDVIFWNHPFHCSSEDKNSGDMLLASVFDTNYRFLEIYFREGRTHLAKDGILLLGSSNVARIRLIKELAETYRYKQVHFEKHHVPVYQGEKVKMDLRIYGFKPN